MLNIPLTNGVPATTESLVGLSAGMNIVPGGNRDRVRLCSVA
jgi:hypothetical protein